MEHSLKLLEMREALGSKRCLSGSEWLKFWPNSRQKDYLLLVRNKMEMTQFYAIVTIISVVC